MTDYTQYKAKKKKMILLRNISAVVAAVLLITTIIAMAVALTDKPAISTRDVNYTSASTGPNDAAGTEVNASLTESIPASSGSQATTVTTEATQQTTGETTLAETKEETTTSIAKEDNENEGDASDLSGYIVVLDPGHQTHANSEQEPVAPGSSATKDKCSSGTSGVSTGRPEYEVNLEISQKIRDYLTSLGCEVHMTRTENDVDISNIERAEFALSYDPDVYIRIHCNGSDNASTRGISVFVADSGDYADDLPAWGEMLGEALADTTGSKYLYCDASSTYSGLNWATDVPSFLLELGFMTNPEEDELLSDSDYQDKICEGVAQFVADMPKR